MNIKKLEFLIVFLFFLSATSNAAFISNYPVTVTQPDGMILKCFVTGDEFYNRLHDANNYTIVRNSQTGYYCYAVKIHNELVASAFVAGKTNPSAAGLQPGIDISAEKVLQLRKKFHDMPPRLKNSSSQNTKAAGTLNNIVIFVRFAGEAEFSDSISLYNDLFVNTPGNVSMKNYFEEASYNQLHINSVYYPSPGTLVISYQDAYTRDHYLPYDALLNPDGYTDQMYAEHNLLANAVNAVKSQIPSGLNIDFNNDGFVDNICFVISGDVSAWNTLLWPHRWTLYSQVVYINGKQVGDYNLQVRNYLLSNGVGVLCHEMFHTLGAPDLYHYSQDGLSPVDAWDLMGNDLIPPQSMGAYMKYRYGNWISSVPVISAPGNYTLYPVTNPNQNCYRINSPNSPTEYFIVEYRKKEGYYESSLPGSGLIVYRINSDFDGMGNGYYDGSSVLDEVYIYRPYGTSTVNGYVDNAYFSAGVNRRKINNNTNPSCFLSDGSFGSLNISNVTAAGSTISFDLNDGPAYPVNTGIEELLAPSSGCGLTTTEHPAVMIKNFGTNPVSSGLQVHYQVNGGVIVTEAYNGSPIPSGTSVPYTFAQHTDFSSPGNYTITAWTSIPSDGNHANDTLVIPVTNGSLAYIAGNTQNFTDVYNDLGTNGNVISTADYDDANSAPVSIGFTFHYNCMDFTQIILNTNGFIKLGNIPPSSAALFFTGAQDASGGIFNSLLPADVNIISAFNHDLMSGTAPPEYRVHTSGSAPDRICTIQFKNLRDKTTTPAQQYDNISFQIKLFETTNQIEIVYGSWQASANVSDFKTSAVGLKGPGREYGQLLVARKGSTQEWSQVIFENVNYSSTATLNFGNPPLRPAPGTGRTFLFSQEIPPDVITVPATAVTTTSAVLNGFVDANNVPTTVSFEYGINTNYGNIITATPNTLSGNTSVPVSASISGLSANTLYHFRVKATNSLGTFYGNDSVFIAQYNTTIDNPVVSSFAVSPNPVRELLTISVAGQPNNASITIYDLRGQLIYTSVLQQAVKEINTSWLASGVYFIRISDKENIIIKKFVKQ
ncbi:MAG TPA: M6 family metalloprotease domain-containing protein [Bacteroidales bacterium]|nr:M6 family metalloprotease domain-containing protein [Bacteroidales bacterium]